MFRDARGVRDALGWVYKVDEPPETSAGKYPISFKVSYDQEIQKHPRDAISPSQKASHVCSIQKRSRRRRMPTPPSSTLSPYAHQSLPQTHH